MDPNIETDIVLTGPAKIRGQIKRAADRVMVNEVELAQLKAAGVVAGAGAPIEEAFEASGGEEALALTERQLEEARLEIAQLRAEIDILRRDNTDLKVALSQATDERQMQPVALAAGDPAAAQGEPQKSAASPSSETAAAKTGKAARGGAKKG